MYFNDNDPQIVQWLQNLFPDAHVDSRDIHDVTADDLRHHRRIHLFAGIGGWEYALRLAEWPEDVPVWTGSCPCQPYSVAGRGAGNDDPRNLWPEMRRLLGQRRPPIVFGEQVASRAGRDWLSGVRTDLEKMGYVVGAADLCAPCAGEEGEGRIVYGCSEKWESVRFGPPHIRQRLYWGAVRVGNPPSHDERGVSMSGLDGEREQTRRPGGSGAWSDFDVLSFRDVGKDGRPRTRRVEPGAHPLAHGIPNRSLLLRAYGNAIIPQVAAIFIQAFWKTIKKMKGAP